ncbi:MAG: hypothetical protein P1U67_11150 [Alcanivoracaceae bacterium]|nr:hypothetical protein [Alcanivoracaceae bacterium]
MTLLFKQKSRRALVVGCIAASAAMLSAAGFAETPSKRVLTPADLGLTEAQIRDLVRSALPPAASPGISMGSPVGFGASWGSAGIGIGGATAERLSQDVDGSAGVVFGLGDATKTVGLETSLNIISLTNNAPGSDVGEDGNFGLKLHKTLKPDLAVSIGAENVMPWGAADNVDSSYYVAVTKFLVLGGDNPSSLALNFGVGEGRFDYDGNDDVGAFGSIAWIPSEKYSLIADWTGRDLNAGVSLAPLHDVPVTITLGAINLGERLGQDTEFSGGVGYSFSF